MQIRLLGSAAAEGWPALFCECESCQEARRRGGRNLRRRTAYAINQDILVDFGPDILWQSLEFGLDLSLVQHLFVTHSHPDHLYANDLTQRRQGFSVVTRPLNLYGNAGVLAKCRGEKHGEFDALKIHAVEMTPGQCVETGTCRVTAIEAAHGSIGETPLNYLVEEGKTAILIGNDSGWWRDATWETLKRFRLDLAILECTYLHLNPQARGTHLGAEATIEVKNRLHELGVLKPKARVVANHFSHNGRTLHEELCAYFAPHGIEVGYDGLVVKLGRGKGKEASLDKGKGRGGKRG